MIFFFLFIDSLMKNSKWKKVKYGISHNKIQFKLVLKYVLVKYSTLYIFLPK